MKRRLDDGIISAADADSGGFSNSRTIVQQGSYSQPTTIQYTMPVLGVTDKIPLAATSTLLGGASSIVHQVGQIRQKVHSTVVTTPPHIPEQPAQFHRLKVEDALSYLDQVKFKFGNQPQVYNDFLDIMKEFKSQSIDTPGVITRVSNLFKGHPELIVGFNTFLPPGYKIEIQANDQGYSFQVSVSVPSPSSSSPALTPTSTVHHTTTTHHVINRPSLPPSPAPIKSTLISVSHANNTSPALLTSAASTLSNSHAISQAQAHQAVTQALIQVESGHTSPHNQPVEFNHAINYVNKIKNRFQGQPDKYKKFLEILHTYQKEQKTFKEMNSNSGGKTLTEAEVYSQVAKLFENQEDLLAEFGKFLPDATNHHSFGSRKTEHLELPRVPTLNVKMPTFPPNNSAPPPSNINNSNTMPSNNNSNNNNNNTNTNNNNNGSNSGSSPSVAPKYNAPPSNSSMLKRPSSYSSNVPPMYHTPAKKLKSLTQLRDVSLAEVAKYGNLNDYAYFDKVRKAFHNPQVYENFLRCLILYNHEIISRVELLQLVTPYLNRFPDLLKWFKDFLSLNDVNNTTVTPSHTESVKTEYPKPQNLPHLSLLDTTNNVSRQERMAEERNESGTCSTLDYTNLKRLGASYCALPRNYVQPRCSGRTTLCKEVLNDTWVSFPSWSEDSTFVTSRKTQFEEYIYRCEDERFELDVVIESNNSTIKALESVLKKISRFSAEELAKFRLDDCLGGFSPTIHVRALRRVYGDKAHDLIEGVKKNPIVAIPVVLRRLKSKDEEWREAQKGFNKIWREQNEKFYLKSLDHQGINFKQNDIKQLRSKSLFNEIESLDEERNEQGLENPAAGPHLILEYRDKSIIDDAANLLIHHVKRQAGIHKEDKQKIKALIRQFIPDLFHHPRQELSDDEKDDLADNDSLSNPSSPKPEEPSTEEVKKEGEDEKMDITSDVKTEPNEDQQSNKENESDTNSKEKKENKEKDKEEETKSEEENKNNKIKKEKNPPSMIPPYPDEYYTLFFGNNYWYLFFRLHQILCDRLSQMYEHASVLAQIESKHKTSRQESTAIALRLKPKTEIEVEDYYPALLDMVKNVLDGNMESNSYEDTLRELFGIHAYIAFTLDKIVSNAVRQLQHLVSDETCIECYETFLKESKKSATGGLCETAHQRLLAEQGYQKKLEVTMTDENCFKIIIYKKDCKLTIELLDTESSDNEGEDNDNDNDEDKDDNEPDPDQSTQDSEKWSPYEEEPFTDRNSAPVNEENLVEPKVESDLPEQSTTDSQETDPDQDTPEQ
uniref:Paired amphipathic helix protein Sin3a n=1 Tax=Cacopsylla melanoneura TaxID=428564 RepID=A0A8D9BTT3_9HEMI